MIFGDPSDFAIEVELDFISDSPQGTVWGHMRLWLQSQPFGRFNEQHCGISGVAQELKITAERLHQLELADFAKLDDQSVWEFIDHKLFVNDERTLEQLRRDAKTWSPFSFLTNSGESFDGYKGIIFCPDNENVRVLVKYADTPIRAVSVSRKAFHHAVTEFYKWCGSLEIERDLKGT